MARSCPHCNTDNRDTAQFCAQCALPLRQTCPHCEADNPIRSRFCNQCGEALIQELACAQCGQINPSGSRFCNDCGFQLSAPSPSSPGLEHPISPPPVSTPVYPPTATGTGQLPAQTILAERYIILDQVRRGGMSAVYQAGDSRIPGKTWAIKEMSDAAITSPLDKQRARDAFRQEAQILASLDHAHLPKVTDHFSQEGRQYLVMDFIEGGSLADRLEGKYGEPLPVKMVLAWAEQLCDVLEYLHSRNPPVIFRDLKPSNVMITLEGTIKLIDFGIARIFKPGKASDTAYFGTAGYCPREQYGRGQTDARSDVYALGALLHHLLTGADPTDQPFQFEDIRQLNDRVPAHVEEIVMKALQDDPVDRWQSIAQMKARLIAQLPPEPRLTSTPPQPHPADSKPAISAAPRPAMSAAAQAEAPVTPQLVPAAAEEQGTAAPQPMPAPTTPRLNFRRGLGLTVVGTLLYVIGSALAQGMLWELDLPPTALMAFIPALFGVLFGPWIGGLTGGLGFILWDALVGGYWYPTWGLVFAHCFPGLLSGLIAKDAQNWKTVLRAGLIASGAFALAVPVIIGILEGWWGDSGVLLGQFFTASLLPNLILLPLCARWLVKPVRRRGLYWRDTR